MKYPPNLPELQRSIALHALAGDAVTYELVHDFRQLTVHIESPRKACAQAGVRIAIAVAHQHDAYWNDEGPPMLTVDGVYVATVYAEAPADGHENFFHDLVSVLNLCGVRPRPSVVHAEADA